MLTVTASQPNLDLAAGGQNQATFTISNSQVDAPVNVTLAEQGPPGVTVAMSAASEQVPAGGSVTVTADVGLSGDLVIPAVRWPR